MENRHYIDLIMDLKESVNDKNANVFKRITSKMYLESLRGNYFIEEDMSKYFED